MGLKERKADPFVGPFMGDKGMVATRVYEAYMEKFEQLKRFIVPDAQKLVYDAVTSDQTVGFELAQGPFLCYLNGTYPYNTSTCTTPGAVATAAGIPQRYIQHYVGVWKAIWSKVGGGPFVTEYPEDVNEFEKSG